MKKWILVAVIFAASFVVGVIGWKIVQGRGELVNPMGQNRTKQKELPYKRYAFEELASKSPSRGEIEIGGVIEDEDEFEARIFYYKGDGKKISGQIDIPKGIVGKLPVIVMARGYVEKDEYATGVGTKNAAAYYAKQGYITLAPDFAGYGESDSEEGDAIGARLAKPVEVLDLLASLSSLPQADVNKVFLWGHSNGGQIMLSVAEILGMTGGEVYPQILGLTLWAPVSKPFPYSILYYTDEADDKGKWLRKEIANFEDDYDVYLYSIDMYWDSITFPVQVHQGTYDDAVPREWSDELIESLEKEEVDVTYYVYPGADHNLRPSWGTVVERDAEWFASDDILGIE